MTTVTSSVPTGYRANVGTEGRGEIPGRRGLDQVRVMFENGILNPRSGCQDTAKLLSWVHGDVNVHFVADPTLGIVEDLAQAAELELDVETKGAKNFARLAKNLIRQMNEESPGQNNKLLIYAHSKGGLTAQVGMSHLTPEERSQVQLRLIGSPADIHPDFCADAVSYEGAGDLVPLLNPAKPLDSVKRIIGAIAFASFGIGQNWGRQCPVVHVPSHADTVLERINPLYAHPIMNPTYLHGACEIMGNEFRARYLDGASSIVA